MTNQKKYLVVAVCVDIMGRVVRDGVVDADSDGRIGEVIDTDANAIFGDCHGPWAVEDRYEAFWNRLNSSWEHRFPAGKERVKVLKVVPLEDDDAAALSGRLSAATLTSLLRR